MDMATPAKDSPVQPVKPGERIFELDVLRGFAIFGVLLAYLVWNLGTLPQESFSTLDTYLELFFEFAVDSKFYTILSFFLGSAFIFSSSGRTKRERVW